MNKSKATSLKTDTYGTCAYAKTTPRQNTLSSATRIFNIFLPFEEALKLNLAIDECIRELNRYKRSTTAGKRAALNLAVHLDQGRIAIREGTL
jgi:hypothetical protein